MRGYKNGDYLPLTPLRRLGDGSSYEIVQDGLVEDWGGREGQHDGDCGEEAEPDQWGSGSGHSDGDGP